MRIIQPWISQWAWAMPAEAPVPARPMRCSEPMLEAKMEAPIAIHVAVRPLRK